jgi:hypothetical protein
VDTRIRITTIVDYKNFYGFNPHEEAVEIIKNIPSNSVLYYISFLNTQLYLNDHPEEYDVQKKLILTLTLQAGESTQQKLNDVFDKYKSLNQLPVIIWNYSNLIFYDLIFSNYNSTVARDLSTDEVRKIFDAYLTINSITDERFNIPEDEIKQYTDDKNIELFAVSKFMYQRDYFSTTEMHNQFVRGCLLFEFMEKHSDYGAIMPKYYQSQGVSGYQEMFGNLLLIFTQSFIVNEQGVRNNIIDLNDYQSLLNLKFVDNLSINESITTYKKDLNFSILRNKMLYKISAYKYLVLNINFLINYFYKTQIFSLNKFLTGQKITSDFLSVKAKKFMEDIYFKKIMTRCFKDSILHFGDTAVVTNNNELCDCNLREDNKIALFELKDVILNSVIKDSANIDEIIDAIKRKFLANEKNKAKGIGQLINAIKIVNNQILSFDPEINSSAPIEIFPVIMYTDDAFSCDGLNKILNNMFQEKSKDLQNCNIKVHPLTIINLNFLELFENFFSENHINLFSLIEKYHFHIATPDYHLTPFEIFSKFYLRDNISQDPDVPQLYSEYSKNVLERLLPLV